MLNVYKLLDKDVPLAVKLLHIKAFEREEEIIV